MNALTERQARRIAAGGREALLARLRPVFERHAAARGDALILDDGELDELVLRAAARADGALWRRALADVAIEWLEIDLTEAVNHPAVIRAHELAGAPSWTPLPVATPPVDDTRPPDDAPASDDAPPLDATPTADGMPPLDAGHGGDSGHEDSAGNGVREADDGAVATWTLEADRPLTFGGDDEEPAEPSAGGDEDGEQPSGEVSLVDATGALRVPAIHLGGIETVKQGDRDIELRFSDAGLDVIKRSSGAPIGRLEWDEIRTIELPRARRGLRPGRRKGPELHVGTRRGRASFELPGITDEQVRDHLEPMLERAQGADTAWRRER